MRAKAMRAPGMFLSQAPRARTPSIAWELQTASIESAMISRETREYFMPSVPMEIPSLTVMVPNSSGMTPASRSAASAFSASSPSPMLQGVTVLWPLARPTRGLSKSLSWKPIARSMERLGARRSPAVVTLLRRSTVMAPPREGTHHTADAGVAPSSRRAGVDATFASVGTPRGWQSSHDTLWMLCVLSRERKVVSIFSTSRPQFDSRG